MYQNTSNQLICIKEVKMHKARRNNHKKNHKKKIDNFKKIWDIIQTGEQQGISTRLCYNVKTVKSVRRDFKIIDILVSLTETIDPLVHEAIYIPFLVSMIIHMNIINHLTTIAPVHISTQPPSKHTLHFPFTLIKKMLARQQSH